MIYSQKSSFGRLLPNSSDSPDAPLTVSTKYIRAVEYDPIQHYVYWVISIMCFFSQESFGLFFILFLLNNTD
jgi:hypothetical protein